MRQQDLRFRIGGRGRSCDRTIANRMLDEVQKDQMPSGEIWLQSQDAVYTDQLSLGLRKRLAGWPNDIASPMRTLKLSMRYAF